MEIRNGFIVGIYNYCDSWCDRCAFTSHCRVFADLRETEAMLDPNLAPVVSAPEHPADTQPPPPQWLQQLLQEINDSSSAVSYTHLRAHETPEHLVCRL